MKHLMWREMIIQTIDLDLPPPSLPPHTTSSSYSPLPLYRQRQPPPPPSLLHLLHSNKPHTHLNTTPLRYFDSSFLPPSYIHIKGIQQTPLSKATYNK